MAASGEPAVDEIEALTAELNSVCFSVSHDLRAPVRAVVGFARALEEDYAPVLDAEGRRLLAVIATEAARINTLIDGILALSRLGRAPMENVPVDMTVLAREVAGDEAAAGSSPVIANIHDLPGTSGDRTMLRMVWSHLISNAAKFSSQRPDPQFEIHSTPEPGRVVYHVRDNGIGFDMKYADKLFGVFQRLHAGDAFAGSGVGLAMVKRIVHRHGGTIWANARLGEGATFSFGLPVSRGS
jgi:light-regulated signal transduction histidine kinase (bacteriophytochrome)